MVILFCLLLFICEAWKSSDEEMRDTREYRNRGVHYHSKRHMLSSEPAIQKRRVTTQRSREIKKKPSGHLAPLEEDDMDNDEVISVAIGPPPIKPKYDRMQRKQILKPTSVANSPNFTAVNLIRDVLSQLGKDFMFRQVNEDFVFGQYIGNAMKNLTSDLRLSMQHEILELVVKYQKLNHGDISLKPQDKGQVIKEGKFEKRSNDTDETWPDFTNLAKIVG
ncbi:hypothetical protein K1T71_007452 [Dendrolimus kikuchii]|uniref:Uncharacterized protein n=1 Tax=Dendrolimus kikuchii TaxID=765133 RepID=A0ACC1D0J6_9NEOP|nr:hypothetical protein K1T71_007452 [Dendrolimus kikuchii]